MNFGLIYGEGIDQAVPRPRGSREEGEEIMREYHEGVPFMRPLMDHYKDQARNTREVRTLFGRRRHFNRWEHQRRQDHRQATTASQLQAGLHLYRPERQDPGQRRRHHEARHGQDLGERRLRRGRSTAPDSA